MTAFDPCLAVFRTIRLPCAHVIDPLAITHAPERIAQYRDCMRAGDRFPPVSVIRLGGRYVLVDGHKRFTAYQGLGADEIVVEIWPLGRWFQDQWRQVRDNLEKNRRIIATAASDPAAAWRLLLTTLLHWRRVAASLASRATGRLR